MSRREKRTSRARERPPRRSRGDGLLRRIIEHTVDGIVVVDADGAVCFANSAAERLFGRPREQLVSAPFGFPVADETAELDLPGDRVAEMRVVELVWEGRPALLASLRDVTERREAEETARRLFRERAARDAAEREQARLRDLSCELESALARLREEDRRKDQLMAMLGHELRNPLAAIDAGLAVLDAGDGDPALRKKMLAMMRRQVRRQAALLGGLLDVSSVVRGTLRLERRVVPLASIVEAAIEGCRDRRDERQRLEVRLPAEPLPVEADPQRLEQVVCNLLDNAIKFSPPDGPISLAVCRDGGEAVLEVSDQGAGIDPEMLQTIFEPFLQVPQEVSSPASGGLGIGLTLVQRLVELHGGSVSAQSAGRGKGSTFTVRLPLAGAGGGSSASSASGSLASPSLTA